jgi:hypothetical protein
VQAVKHLLVLFILTSCAASGLTLGPGGSLSFAGTGWVVLVGENTAVAPASRLNATMTSNIAPSPNVATSAWHPPFGAAYLAFDGNYATSFIDQLLKGTGFLKYDFGAGNAKVSTSFKLKNKLNLGPNAYVFAGSNDDSTYDTLKSGNATNNETLNTYSFSNTTAYRYYKFSWSSLHGGSEAEIFEVEIW